MTARADRERAASIHAKAVELVRASVEMTTAAGSGHPTSAASLAHLVAVLLYDHMRWDPGHPAEPGSDRLVLSEGHAVPVLYAAMADLGVPIGRGAERRPLTPDDLHELRAIDSPLEGHPRPASRMSFFPAATGSLGQGLSVAAGLALAARLDGSNRRVFCLIGDGESREGQVWEALDFIVDHDLRAVCPVFNANGFGQTGPVSCQQSPEVIARRLEAQGLEAIVLDGHDPEQIVSALARHASRAGAEDGRPVALVAHTVKGWGMPSLASQPSGKHGESASADERARALEELGRTAASVGAHWTEGALHRRTPEAGDRPTRIAPERAPRRRPALRETLAAAGAGEQLDQGRLSTRKAYGYALAALGRSRPDVVVLDGDVSNSTYSGLFAADPACAARYFEGRIAEQNMVSVASGLAAGGKRAFVSSFGKFLTRAYDQVEMALIGGHALRLVGSHVGVSLAADGPSQMALPDAAWFGAWTRVRRDGRPLMYVLTPSDAHAAHALTFEMADHDGASYLRTMRPDVPLLADDGSGFTLGGHRVRRDGADLLIVAWGWMVHEGLSACEHLASRGVEATLVDAYSLPFDPAAIVALARENHERVLALEDDYGGALGATVAEALADAGGGAALRQMSVRRVPKSGRTPQDVVAWLGLSSEDVVREALRLVETPAGAT